MYLSPDLGARVPIPEAVSDELTGMVARIEDDEDVTSASPDLADRFPAPQRADDLRELVFTGRAQGRGLFGSSDVWITETPSSIARELLSHEHDRPAWSRPDAGVTRPATIELGNERKLGYAVRVSAPVESSA